jgi:hypothetical protein
MHLQSLFRTDAHKVYLTKTVLLWTVYWCQCGFSPLLLSSPLYQEFGCSKAILFAQNHSCGCFLMSTTSLCCWIVYQVDQQ